MSVSEIVRRGKPSRWKAKGLVNRLRLTVHLGYFNTREEAEEAVVQWRLHS